MPNSSIPKAPIGKIQNQDLMILYKGFLVLFKAKAPCLLFLIGRWRSFVGTWLPVAYRV